jgi:hypothetical protein
MDKMVVWPEAQLRVSAFNRNVWNGLAIHSAKAYIEENPVRSGLIKMLAEWRWSSGCARANKKGLVPEVFKIPVLLKERF